MVVALIECIDGCCIALRVCVLLVPSGPRLRRLKALIVVSVALEAAAVGREGMGRRGEGGG